MPGFVVRLGGAPAPAIRSSSGVSRRTRRVAFSMSSPRDCLRRSGAYAPRAFVSSVMAVLSLSACIDQGPRAIAESFRVVESTPVAVAVGETIELRGECLDSHGRVIRGTAMSWVVPLEAYEADSIRGRVVLESAGDRVRIRGVNVGGVTVAGGCMSRADLAFKTGPYAGFGPGGLGPIAWFSIEVTEEPDSLWYVDLSSDTLRLRAPADDDSLSGVEMLLTIRSLGSAAFTRDPAEFTWRSDDSTVATVAPDGLVRALRAGETVVRIARGSRERSVPVAVAAVAPADGDVDILDAHWTQGAQDALQRVPIVRNGRAAVVNVLAFATRDAPPSFVVLEVWDASATRIWTDRVPLAPSTEAAPSFDAPSAQFLVPRDVVRRAVTWRVLRDNSTGPDASVANDAWPRSGVRTLLAYSAPRLELRLVPLRLSAHDNVSTSISDAERVYYDSIARIRLPLGEVIVTVEPPLTVSQRLPSEVELLIDPSADDGIYQAFLDAVDARRMASGARRSAYWLGVIPQHAPGATAGVVGMAFVPTAAGDDGPFTRSMIARGHDWYASPVSTGNTVAHELGHNLGLRHAPCGSAGWPDPAYPLPGGVVGTWVHWVSAWEHGTQTSAALISPTLGDFMGYCSSNWVSPYNTRAIIEWMALGGASLRAAASPRRVVAVRGAVSGEITLHSVNVVDADPAEGTGAGPLVELLSADGSVQASVHARVGQLSDGTAVPFVAFIPVDPATDVTGLRVRVTHGSSRVVAPVTTP